MYRVFFTKYTSYYTLYIFKPIFINCIFGFKLIFSSENIREHHYLSHSVFNYYISLQQNFRLKLEIKSTKINMILLNIFQELS